MPSPYKRILLKLSGEALMGSQGHGIDLAVIDKIAQEVKEIHEHGIEIAFTNTPKWSATDLIHDLARLG